jgi:hypothetical protein
MWSPLYILPLTTIHLRPSLSLLSQANMHTAMSRTRAATEAVSITAAGVLHIRAHPPPSTMAARQRVLAALREFGDVEHFRSLKVCFIFI